MAGWTDDELQACVAAYFQMAENDTKGVPYNKAELYRQLSQSTVNERTPKSIEYRMQNISYVLQEMGEPWINGLKPASNVGANIAERIRAIISDLKEDPTLLEPTFDRTQLQQRTKKLRKRGITKKPEGQSAVRKKEVTYTAYARVGEVRAWVLDNAKGICELCNNPAPFTDADGEAFLEVHHVVPLAESLRDTTDNAVALCPNCHRRCHYGADKDEVLEQMYVQVKRLVRV